MYKLFKKFKANEHADVQMVGAVIGILVTILVAILVLYNVVGALDYSSVDSDLQDNLNYGDSVANDEQYAENASNELLSHSETFFTIAPIIAIVVVAVVILGYVSRIGGA